jgi:cystathionine gamma-synthase
MHIETLSVHAGRSADPTTGAVAQPIVLSTTFERDESGELRAGYLYSRDDNPNRSALETALASLEEGAAAAAFSSGSAATMAVLQALSPGDHVVIPSDRYHGMVAILRDIVTRWGLEHTVVDMGDLDAVSAAMTERTRIVWVETPSNPLLRVTDIAAVAAIAHARGARVVADNTFTTPVVQRPFEHGADIVMYATTKYLAGHSDVLGGALVTRGEDELWERIRAIQRVAGAVPSPFECWLALRSLATLPLRMRAHSDGAMAVARYLEAHPAVRSVHYPGLASHPGHDVAARQMRMFSGMLSFQHGDGEEAAKRVVGRARLLRRATSLGGVESLIEHRATSEGPHSTAPRDLIRLSVGIEHPDDLIDDLARALGDV